MCSKFVYEKFGGTCELHSGVAELYYTFALISGTVDGKADPPERPASKRKKSSATDYDEEPALIPMEKPTPPTPPGFIGGGDFPPPFPPGEDDSTVSQDVLTYFSLVAIFFLGITGIACTFLLFASELNAVLQIISGGALGKKTKSPQELLAEKQGLSTSNGELTVQKKALKQLKAGHLPPGWAKVAVTTSQLSQKKDMDIGDCKTYEELRQLIWDTFGHMLTHVAVNDLVLLAWLTEDDDDDDDDRIWMLVTEESDMDRVRECGAIKATPKELAEESSFAALPAPPGVSVKDKDRRRSILPALTSGSRSKNVRKKGGFHSVASSSPTGSQDESGSGSGSDHDRPHGRRHGRQGDTIALNLPPVLR
jgi:hypothetical protein